MKQPINRTQMESFSKALETVKQHKSLSTEQFNSLHTHFQAEDASGVVWTVGIHTRKWHRIEQGKWVQGYPPEALYLDENLLKELQELGQAQAATSCKQCGATLQPGKKFCSACGTPVGAEPQPRRCSRCGQEVAVGKKFCHACGTRVA